MLQSGRKVEMVGEKFRMSAKLIIFIFIFIFVLFWGGELECVL